MFDIGWSELLVVVVVAIVVVGPRELPRMLRTFGKTMGQVRRTANDFKRQFDDALREAEREADLADIRSEMQALGKIDPLKDAKAAAALPTAGPLDAPAKPMTSVPRQPATKSDAA